LLEIRLCFLWFFVTSATASPIKVIVPLYIGLQYLWIYKPWLCSQRLVSCGDTSPDLLRDVAGHILFEREHCPQIALIALRPEMFVRTAFDKLRGDAYLITGTLDRSLDDSIHVQFACNFR